MKPILPLKLPQRSSTQLQHSMEQTLAQHPSPHQGVWLFVYGHLAKQPPFKFVTQKPWVLRGWQRSFHLADSLNRGTSNAPGLTLGLQPGTQCAGMAYLLSWAECTQALMPVWEQEMLVPFYTPQWLQSEGTLLLTMVTDPASPALWQPLSVTETAAVIASSSGAQGSNTTYLTDVIDAFAEHHQPDPYLASIKNALSGT
ncbi:MAG: hypothetical protein EOP52_13560 [Sphingobacteriales bacterium]|nr:MAG: hypothetical protein EOP52_13560 [Sphingobacteriales bacterium]